MNAKEVELTEAEYEELLDEIYGEVQICGMTYSSGRALRELDPIAFRCGKSDYESSMETAFECTECDKRFEDESEAELCCKEEEDDDDGA